MANRNWSNGGKVWMMETAPVTIPLSFQVKVADSAGLGITAGSLKGPTVAAVYMHTTATKATGSPGGTTGPASGTIVINLQDNYTRLLGFDWSAVASIGTPVQVDNSALTAGVAYTITTLGNSTTAQLQSIGLPIGITPAVGVTFIANAVGIAGEAATSTTRVAPSIAAGSNIFSMESLGNPQLLVAPTPSANQGYGCQVILQTRNDSAADAPAIATPTDLTIFYINLRMSNSSVSVQGS